MVFGAVPKLGPLLTVGVVAALVGCGSSEDGGSSGERKAEPVGPKPAVSASVRLMGKTHGEDAISAIAAGEDAVWVSRSGCLGSVSRIDPESNELVAKVAVGFVTDVAVGEGAVWALGGVCPGRRFPVKGHALFRIDPRTDELVETIPVDLSGDRGRAEPRFVAAGEGGVWVSVQSSPTSGEILRIDPRRNEVAARIPIRGAPADIAVGAGALWVLSHPEFTERATGAGRGSSLLRIDPRADEVVATLAREKLAVSAGGLVPLMAVGESSVWASGVGAAPAAFRVNADTNEVAREHIDGDRFNPVAVTEDGVWLLGPPAPNATLQHLNSQTLEVDQSLQVEFPRDRKYPGGISAVFDPDSRSFWLASGLSVVRVDLR